MLSFKKSFGPLTVTWMRLVFGMNFCASLMKVFYSAFYSKLGTPLGLCEKRQLGSDKTYTIYLFTTWVSSGLIGIKVHYSVIY